MPDNKTVTFDASQWQLVPKVPTQEMLDAASHASMQHFIDCLYDPEKAKEIGSEENVRKTHASRYQSMLTAAPTPAAQSPGQEAMAAERIARVAALRRPEITTIFGVELLTLIHAYRAAVYAYARASELRKEQTYVDVSRAEKRIVDAFYAAPVNGGERERIEAEQRQRMNEKFANRKFGPATADFDLPAPNDDVSNRGVVQTPCYQCKGCGDSEYGPWRCNRCDGTGFERAADAPQVSGGIRGPLMDAQASLARSLAFNLRNVRDGEETLITHIAATAYSNGVQDAALSSPAKVQKDCPHAAPHRYCAECVETPCPIGLGEKK